MTGSSKETRFAEFLRRLAASPSANGDEEAFRLLGETLNEVENEFTDIPYAPENWQADGRMYPPQEDAVREVPARDDLVRYRSKTHSTHIRKNGAIEIRDRQGAVIFSKLGADGKGVDLQSN